MLLINTNKDSLFLMNYGIFRQSVFLSFVLFSLFLSIQGQKTSFGIEEKRKTSVAPTAAVWKVLKKYAAEYDCGKPKKKWFQISKVNLNNDKIYDLIVYPKESCIQGNNIANFLVFRGLGTNNFRLVLKIGAFSVSILKNSENQFKQIAAYSFVGQEVMIRTYSFRKKNYRLVSEKYEKI